jgi:hypothetical protein
MARIGIVCGYDRHTDLDQYTQRVADELSREPFDAIIVTGGFTDPRSRQSEAQLMSAVVLRSMPHVMVVLEERAMTTLDNLVYGKAVAEKLFARIDRFVVFCDGAHRLKVSILTRLILGVRGTVRTVHRAVPFIIHLLEPASIVIESAAALVPPLRKYVSAAAARMKGVTPATELS